MAKSNKVLSIDITNESITIIELTASAKKQTMIHNIIIFETPEDSYEDGVLKEPEKIAEAITQQLMARGINNKNAIFVLSSTKIKQRGYDTVCSREKDQRNYQFKLIRVFPCKYRRLCCFSFCA